ncbi:Gfo/Idh/MocA family protein [Paraburkholderia lacunae]|uniref:1-carboxy-3-chloro-3,4-dihydroxycyclo hexa-1,5-diene dehydrogenase n=1 Tax=Paraburkholderia lacunae TaxID=2211104 RepID=A0A370MYV8_9BURK|nr:Gfo/Idh/MocA family oxidoreductase [Paraburkholderia lacunae]RDJ98563.1 1-carboxy-3-chloro-3,4-dihydroxycyclo hexa-1,5-diene dehydrogenase [Paraburkholderia lacunae]
MRREIGVAVIGTGFMGKAHALAYRAVPNAFPNSLMPRMVAVADVSEAGARQAAEQFGFEHATGDWRSLLDDHDIEVVSITTPCSLHREMALAAIAAGKHVHCEKPIAPSASDACEMMKAAESTNVVTQVGYNYIKNPILKLAREMIASGELGEITSFRGIHAEDYMADPEIPYNWRVDPQNGAGALAEIGNHIVGMARFLLGPITHVNAQLETVNKTRPVSPGSPERREVKVDDIARLMVTFDRGCSGSIEANWTATGRKMQLEFEIYGTKGALCFSQERFNELKYFKAGGDPRTSGFTRIEAGPAHPPYENFTVADGHQLGFNDLKTIEMAEFIAAIEHGTPTFPDFREAWEIQRIVDAAIRSSAEAQRVYL